MEVTLSLEGRQELRVARIGMVVGKDQSLPTVKASLQHFPGGLSGRGKRRVKGDSKLLA